MPSHPAEPPRRERFITDPHDAHQRFTLALLLAQDGSTTRLCEAVAGGSVDLHVIAQRNTEEVPDEVRARLPGHEFIERITCLAAHGEVMMDNLSYIALDGLSPELAAELRAGTVPIGHLLAKLWVRRERVASADALAACLWQAVGLPDADATRAYCIVTPELPRMLITETYRHGMLMDRGGSDVVNRLHAPSRNRSFES